MPFETVVNWPPEAGRHEHPGIPDVLRDRNRAAVVRRKSDRPRAEVRHCV